MRNGRNDRGFTLLEILVAVTLLSIGLLGVAGLTVGIMRGNRHSNMTTTATTLAQDKIEDVRANGYSGTPAGTFPEPYNNADFPFYKRVTVVTDNTPSPNMKTVTVTVYWNLDASSVALETVLTDD
ncbi:MAG: prepilin-type N-terminal cleavage/methylation domain-containing protein [Candidatus Binatia bacterium]